MRKGKDYLSELTGIEQDAFKVNFYDCRSDWKVFLNQTYENKVSFFAKAFDWNRANEGHFYWSKIAYETQQY